jgi:hypothetical protein
MHPNGCECNEKTGGTTRANRCCGSSQVEKRLLHKTCLLWRIEHPQHEPSVMKKQRDSPCTIFSASIPFAIETWGRPLRGSTSGGLCTPAEKCRPPGFGNDAGDKKQGTSLTTDIHTRRAANHHSESTWQQPVRPAHP